MGLIACFAIFLSPGVIVELIGNDSLPAFVDMNVAHRLFARLVQIRQRLQSGPAARLSLERNTHENLHGLGIFAHIAGSAPGHFRENAVKGNGLSYK